MSAARRYLLCYDIADPDRLGDIGRYMARRAIRVQYSVYWLEVSAAELAAILADLALLIHPREDDVRVYPLAPNAAWTALGPPPLGAAGLLLGAGVPGVRTAGLPGEPR